LDLGPTQLLSFRRRAVTLLEPVADQRMKSVELQESTGRVNRKASFT
jgi:hypothetical protein